MHFVTETQSFTSKNGDQWSQNACTDNPGVDTYCFKSAESVTLLLEITTLVTPASVTETIVPEETITVTNSDVVTPGSLNWVEKSCGPVSTELTVPMSKDALMHLQHALNDAGYGPISEDGIMGHHTRNAIKHYKMDKGLPVTYTITQDLLNQFGL